MHLKKILVVFLIIFFIIITIFIYPIYSYKLSSNLYNKQIGLQDKLTILKNSPVRKNFPDNINNYLKQHPVYISLTTTPSRINLLENTLASLNQEHVTNILLVIPKKFSRNNEAYTIPSDLLTKYPKLKIIIIEHDLGPITKLIPAINYAKTINPDSLVITIDDDVAYPNGMVNEMIYYAITNNAIVGGMLDNNISAGYFWSKQQKYNLINFIYSKIYWHQLGLRKREFIIGFGAVAYPVKLVAPSTSLMLKLSQSSKACFQSDDLIISYVLNKQSINLAKITNNYFNPNLILPLEYGRQADALHKLSDVMARYQQCNATLLHLN